MPEKEPYKIPNFESERTEMFEGLDRIEGLLKRRYGSWPGPLFMALRKKVRAESQAFADKHRELREKTILSKNLEEVFSIRRQRSEFDIQITSTFARRSFWMHVGFALILTCLISGFFLLRHYLNWTKEIQLVWLGRVGLALLGLCMSTMAEWSRPREADPTASSLGFTSSFMLRASTAIAAAVVIGILLFDESGELKKEKVINAGLASFLVGYSLTLFGAIMDKLMEKLKKVIDVL